MEPASEPSGGMNGDPGDDVDRSSGLVGRDFVKSPTEMPGEAPSPKASSMSGWMNRMSAKAKVLQSEAKEAMTAKNLNRMKQQFTELYKPQNKTVDVELAKLVETVQGSKLDLSNLIKLLKSLTKSMRASAEGQLALSACFEQFATTAPDAAPELSFHHRVQDLFGKNSVGLIEALNFFASKVEEFIAQDIEACGKQVAEYERQRVDYDACRVHFESLKDTNSPKLPGAEAAFLETYNKLSEIRTETWTALCNVERLKTELFQKELAGLMNAVSMYNSGNTSGFEDAVVKMNGAKSA